MIRAVSHQEGLDSHTSSRLKSFTESQLLGSSFGASPAFHGAAAVRAAARHQRPPGLCRWQRRVSGLCMCHHHTSVRWLHRRSTLISCSPMTSAVARHAFVRDAAGTLLRVWCTRLLGLRAHAMVLSSASDNASAPDPQECTSSIVLLAPCVGP